MIAELLAQKAELESKIAELQSAARQENLAKIKALMDEAGLTVADIKGLKIARAGKRATVAPKFRDNDGHAWAGRGKRPNWLTSALAAGKTIDEFRVS